MKKINLNNGDIMKRFGSALAAALVVAAAVFPANASTGQSGAQFLRIGAGARGPGMAGAFSAVADDATAIYWNPAGLAQLDKREATLSYNSYFKDTASQFLGYAHPLSKGTLGIGVSVFGVKNIDKRSTAGDTDSPDMGSFNTSDMSVSIGYANKMALGSGSMNLGAAAKYIRSDLGTKSAATGAVDLGSLYRFSEDGGLSLSLSVLNLGGTLKFEEKADQLPLSVKPGVSYQMAFERMGKLTLAMDSELLIHDNRALLEPGLEWWAHRMVAIRGGYQFGRGTGAGGASVGLGLRLSNLTLDYAFLPYGDLGDTHRLSLGMKF